MKRLLSAVCIVALVLVTAQKKTVPTNLGTNVATMADARLDLSANVPVAHYDPVTINWENNMAVIKKKNERCPRLIVYATPDFTADLAEDLQQSVAASNERIPAASIALDALNIVMENSAESIV